MNRNGILKFCLLLCYGKSGDSFGNSYMLIKKSTVKMLIFKPPPPSVRVVHFGKWLILVDNPLPVRFLKSFTKMSSQCLKKRSSPLNQIISRSCVIMRLLFLMGISVDKGIVSEGHLYIFPKNIIF